ncbi:cytochrome c biogenesis heme-transporting ATPase CcmA [uncultured Cocleimonas sp.]|uniref:cytochrome c biogenesis heme-transporting ATPase CcmA n=1 Tax=uncultured Cocleimonas sp. TaxID=1051587 RepID=UPI00261D39AA|nr:cytochrome c biogenesis heme-transporting ATPase CcmA [uncultured Cocleimonas sp.]
MLEVKNLTCTRGDRELFSDLSFKLENSQLMRLEGTNGSGKTTLLRTLCGLFLADEGEILWDGVEIKKQDEAFRKELLYLGHQNAIKSDLTAYENLKLNCLMSGINVSQEQLMDALDTIGLFAFEDFPVRTLSQGQKRRVALAKLLLSKAKLWILDEPFVALDAAAVEQLQSIIAKHVESGGGVILTTHQEVPLTSGELVRISLNKEKTSHV